MIKRIAAALCKAVNKKPYVKKRLLWLYHTIYKYLPFIVGALTRVPAYLKNRMSSTVIAKPGTLSFSGGAFNPGALPVDDYHILLLAKAQVLPWFKAKGKNSPLHMVGKPISLLLSNKMLKTEQSVVLNECNFPSELPYTIEDLRLFRWNGKIMCNHSFMQKDRGDSSVRSAISILNDDFTQLNFGDIPSLDFPLQYLEKNWVYAEQGELLLLWYSVNPYRVLTLQDEARFTFKTRIHKQLAGKITDPGGFGTLVSFSTNPIDFDDKHWLVIIHQFKKKITGRWYVHWAMLIDKTSLLPVQITSKPIFTGAGARGRVPGYRYISSVVKVKDELFFFAGEGDVYVTVTKKSVYEVQKLFVNL